MLPLPSRPRSVFADPSLWLLLFSNAMTAGIALKEQWNAPTLMWVYLLQSLIIGFFHFLRILNLKRFVTDGLTVNGAPVPPTPGVKVTTAFFFLFHFSAFNGFGALLLFKIQETLGAPNADDLWFILGTVALFFVNHLYSYRYNRSQETGVQNLGAMSFYPYLRIFPTYLISFFIHYGVLLFPVFLLTKTIADALTHIIEHQMFRKGVKT